MAARFPQSATSVPYRIKPEWAAKILVLYWAASADSVHRIRSGDNASAIITRATSGAAFDATNGRITGTSSTYFTDSISGGYGALQETSDFTLGAIYFGDLFNGVGRSFGMSTVPTPDSFGDGAKLGFESFNGLAGVQNSAGLSINALADDVPSAMVLALRNLQSDTTAKQRVWLNGAENTSGRGSTVPNSASLIGSTARPVYFGATVTGTGNTKTQYEGSFLGTGALTDADLAAITADPSILVEATPAPPAAVDLVAAAMSGGSTISTGAVGYTAPPAGTNLSVAPMSGGSTISTGAVTYAPPTVKVTTDAFTAWGDPTPLASLAVPHTSISALDGTFIAHFAGAVTDSNGKLTLIHGALVPGSSYAVSNWDATGANRACKIYQAV